MSSQSLGKTPVCPLQLFPLPSDLGFPENSPLDSSGLPTPARRPWERLCGGNQSWGGAQGSLPGCWNSLSASCFQLPLVTAQPSCVMPGQSPAVLESRLRQKVLEGGLPFPPKQCGDPGQSGELLWAMRCSPSREGQACRFVGPQRLWVLGRSLPCRRPQGLVKVRA